MTAPTPRATVTPRPWQRLQVSDPKLKARFYDEVGLSGVYDPRARVVDVEVRVLNDRVGGAT